MLPTAQNSKLKAISLMVIFFILTGCSAKKQKEQSQVIPVKVIKVALRDMYQTLEYVGNIKAQDEAIIYPKVSGKIIEKVKEDGSTVQKDDVIAYIDRDEVGLKFEKAPVETFIGGIVGRVYVDIGQSVTPQTPVALIVNMDNVKIDLSIPEKYVPSVSPDQEAKVSVDAYPEEEFIGKVTKISPVVDLETRSAPIQLVIDNQDHRLRSGMFAKAKLVIGKYESVPVILKEAIIGKEPDRYAYIVENKKAVLRKITLGVREGPYYQVKDGIKENDLVVIMGQQRLKDGAQVEIEE